MKFKGHIKDEFPVCKRVRAGIKMNCVWKEKSRRGIRRKLMCGFITEEGVNPW